MSELAQFDPWLTTDPAGRGLNTRRAYFDFRPTVFTAMTRY